MGNPEQSSSSPGDVIAEELPIELDPEQAADLEERLTVLKRVLSYLDNLPQVPSPPDLRRHKDSYR